MLSEPAGLTEILKISALLSTQPAPVTCEPHMLRPSIALRAVSPCSAPSAVYVAQRHRAPQLPAFVCALRIAQRLCLCRERFELCWQEPQPHEPSQQVPPLLHSSCNCISYRAMAHWPL